eukprot:2886683-Alexandrium_andersonii.AAC.1
MAGSRVDFRLPTQVLVLLLRKVRRVEGGPLLGTRSVRAAVSGQAQEAGVAQALRTGAVSADPEAETSGALPGFGDPEAEALEALSAEADSEVEVSMRWAMAVEALP